MTKKSGFRPEKYLTEVRGVEVYNSTVVVKRHSKLPHYHEHKRRKIMNLSADSLARLAFVAFNTPAHFPSMVTLTYPDVLIDGRGVKGDLNGFLTWYRRYYPGEVYLWWLEFQKRGAPHFHVLSSVALHEFGRLATVTRSDGETWQTHWDTWKRLEAAWKRLGGGLTAWEIINDAEGGKKYAAKYATKAYQKAVPEGYREVGRFWGYSREGVRPDPAGYYDCSEDQLREALKRGGWDYLPDDKNLLYRELFQAAQAIDLSGLKPAAGVNLPAEEAVKRPKSTYRCASCGEAFSFFRGQCPGCGAWDVLSLVE